MNPGTWPRVQVVYANPARPVEVMSLEAAAERFPAVADVIRGFAREYSAVGVGGRHLGPDVYELRKYTLQDSIRDAAPALLEACRRALPYLADHVAMTLDEGPGDRLAHDQVEAAIAQAEGR